MKRRVKITTIPKTPMKRGRKTMDAETAVTVDPKPVQRSLAYQPNAPQPVDVSDFFEKDETADSGYGGGDENKENNLLNEKDAELFRKHPTMSQDSLYYNHIHTIVANHGRKVVVSMDPRSHGDFTQFKVFKKFADTGFLQRAQQMSLRTIEAERVLLQLDQFADIGNNLYPEKTTHHFETSINEQADIANCAWYRDISRTQNRLVRVSFLCFDHLQPVISSYFQVKLFKRADDGIFKLDQWVSMTIQELEQMSYQRKAIVSDLAKHQ